jgi:hypothetical protein
MHTFRAGVEAHDAEAAAAVHADDVVFRGPMVFKPYTETSAAGAVPAPVAVRVFDDFVYEGESTSEDGRDHALMSRARVDGKDIQGCHPLRHDQDGRVAQLTVMVRPLSAAVVPRDSVAAELGRA